MQCHLLLQLLRAKTPNWNIKADFVETCKCDYGCPCNFRTRKNLVSGEEQDTKIQLPNGFVWKLAEAAKSKTMHITTPNLNFDHTGKNAFYSVVEYKGP
jgi:hypothetical protein